MKIYSSDLLNGSQVDAGNLDITTGDALIIADKQAGTGATLVGLSITGGTSNSLPGTTTIAGTSINAYDWVTSSNISVLGATGAEIAIDDYMIQFAKLNGTRLELFSSFDDSGTVVAHVDLGALSGGSGGSGGGAFNENVDFIPVLVRDSFAEDDFTDSIISETITTSGTATFFTTTGQTFATSATSWTLTLAGSTEQGQFDTLYPSTTTAYRVRVVFADTTTRIVDATVSRTGNAVTLSPVSPATTFGVAIATGDTIQMKNAQVTRTGSGVKIAGNLEVEGTTTTVNSTNTVVADQFITLGEPDGTGAIAARDSGLLSVVSQASGGASTVAAIRYNADGGTGGRWEISNTAAGTGTGVTLASGIPSVNSEFSPISTLAKFTNTFDNGTAATSGTDTTYTFAHGLGNDDLTVNVYENNVQFIPSEITISDTQVIVAIPTGHGITTSTLKVVAIG